MALPNVIFRGQQFSETRFADHTSPEIMQKAREWERQQRRTRRAAQLAPGWTEETATDGTKTLRIWELSDVAE